MKIKRYITNSGRVRRGRGARANIYQFCSSIAGAAVDPWRYCAKERRYRDNAANTGIAVSIMPYEANFEAIEADANVELRS